MRFTLIIPSLVLLSISLTICPAQPPVAEGVVPPDHVRVRSGLGGAYFVAKPLKQKYDQLRDQADALRRQVADASINEAQARREIRKLQEEIQQTLEKIKQAERFVAAARVEKKKQSWKFDLGPAKCLLIRAGRVEVVGWDKPHVECVLEKTVLSSEEDDTADDFAALKVVHRHGPAPNQVGNTRREMIASMTKDGAPLTPAQTEFLEQYVTYNAMFGPMQGKAIDVVEIEGLTHEQGNRQLTIKLKGENHHSIGSQWRRHVRLTVHVPQCKLVGIRGALEGLTVKSLQAGLAIRGEGDRDYDARLSIEDLQGDLTARNIPLHQLENVRGNVSLEQTVFQENSGVNHSGGSRTSYSGKAPRYVYKNLKGDLHLWLCRANVHIENVAGKLDVQNEFGDTRMTLRSPLADAAHRIDSQSGHIEVRITKEAARDLPLLVLTQCGLARAVNADRNLENKSFSGVFGPDGERRNWRGFVTREISFIDLMQRMKQILRNDADRPAGLDIINRAGTVRLEFLKM